MSPEDQRDLQFALCGFAAMVGLLAHYAYVMQQLILSGFLGAFAAKHGAALAASASLAALFMWGMHRRIHRAYEKT